MRLLMVALGAEVALFAAIAPNFLTVGNLAEITRSSVELGLLALPGRCEPGAEEAEEGGHLVYAEPC